MNYSASAPAKPRCVPTSPPRRSTRRSPNFWASQSLRVDFRPDLKKIDVPVLIIHGTGNRLLPIEMTADRLPALIKDARLVRIEGGPHGITWTHRQEVNQAIAEFLAPEQPVS
jgi:pimeloyl-ACP methyl ester carboxylesterase